MCAVHPPADVRANRRYINVSGNTCVPWSMLGSKFGWLHECTIVMLAWLWSLVKALPECIIEECTPRFDWEAFQDLLSKWYVVQSLVYSPCQMGIPVKRQRRYTICIRKDT
jgi:hypothetical protein